MFARVIVCLLIWVTLLEQTGAIEVKASNGTTCVDQSQTIQIMVNKISNQTEALVQSRLESLGNILSFSPLAYNNKKYFVSKFPYKNSTDAEAYCTAIGGYLAEINDASEYRALQNFLLSLPADLVLIGGSDSAVEGTWIFPRTGKPVPILDWIPGQPDNFGDEDCLSLWKTNGGRMNDLSCRFRSSDDRFMCETPILDSP
ncbi:C-type lectin 37Db [Bulinus truncatus]|nr:C-type lectin 37Db [Bulinus truncatus]